MTSASLVIPVYNETLRLPILRSGLEAFLPGLGSRLELIIISDGSTDGTPGIARDLLGNLPCDLKIIELPPPTGGKGRAIREGMLAASGEYRFFTDVDLSVPLDLWPRFIGALNRGADIAIGSRRLSESRVLIHQPGLREKMGHGFTLLTNMVLGTHRSDFTCGFKAFKAECAKRLFSLGRINGWSFDAEILFLAERLGLDIEEIPVTWSDVEGSKVRLPWATLTSMRELVRIKIAWASGRYGLS